MFISKKKHNWILEDTKKHYKTVIQRLEEELEQAKDLKEILSKFSDGLFSINGISILDGVMTYSHNIPDNVLQYTEDILGGKVIKQEGTKCLVIDKEGNVKTGLTKQKADKGYSYKLVRN